VEYANTARDLGRIEGKMDLQLQMYQEERVSNNAWRLVTESRITALETWKTKAMTLWGVTITGLGSLWAMVQFFFK
jgi:hypothetical protein